MTLPDEPRGWRVLQEMAQREPDPAKVAVIIEHMNRLLAAHEEMRPDCDRCFYVVEPGEA